MLWQVLGICELDDNATKKNAGISTTYERIQVELRYKTPYYIHTKSKVLQLKLDDYTLVVLPSHYIIVDKYDVAVIETSDLIISSEDIKYAETEDLASDASVLDKTWKYVNKDGSKDKRYKDNEEIPICSYKVVRIEDGSGFKLLLLSSAVKVARINKEVLLVFHNKNSTYLLLCMSNSFSVISLAFLI